MDSSTINHKIRKYTKKLLASKNSAQAVLYQGKLREYTHIQSGGAPFRDLIARLSSSEGKLNSLSNDLKFDVDTSSIGNLEREVQGIRQQYDKLMQDSQTLGINATKLATKIDLVSGSAQGLKARVDRDIQREVAKISDHVKNMGYDDKVFDEVATVLMELASLEVKAKASPAPLSSFVPDLDLAKRVQHGTGAAQRIDSLLDLIKGDEQSLKKFVEQSNSTMKEVVDRLNKEYRDREAAAAGPAPAGAPPAPIPDARGEVNTLVTKLNSVLSGRVGTTDMSITSAAPSLRLTNMVAGNTRPAPGGP